MRRISSLLACSHGLCPAVELELDVRSWPPPNPRRPPLTFIAVSPSLVCGCLQAKASGS